MCLLENPRTGTKKYLEQMNVKGRLWLVQCSQSGYSKVANSAQNSYTGCVGIIEFNYIQCFSFD